MRDIWEEDKIAQRYQALLKTSVRCLVLTTNVGFCLRMSTVRSLKKPFLAAAPIIAKPVPTNANLYP